MSKNAFPNYSFLYVFGRSADVTFMTYFVWQTTLISNLVLCDAYLKHEILTACNASDEGVAPTSTSSSFYSLK